MNVYLLQVVNGVGIGMLYFLLAVGLSIIFGLLRFVNFAHGAFYALGAYLCFQALQMGMDFWLALVLAPIVIGALAWVTEKVLLRHVYAQAHEFHILVTVGLALVVQELIIVAWAPLGVDVPAPDALQGVVMWGDFVYPKYRLFVIGFSAVLALALWWLLEGTRLGSAVRAGSESTEMVSLLGINVFRLFSLMFALGAATAAVAGVLAAPIRGAEPFMGVEALGVAFVVVVVGGMGSFAGALVGGLLVGIVQSLMSTLWPEGARPAGEGMMQAAFHGISRHRFWWLALGVTLLLPLVLRSGTLATEVLVYAMAVMACNVLLGYTGLLSFGQGIFFGLGSYAAGIGLTQLALPMPVALVLAVVVGAVVAAVVGWFAIRQRGTYFVMLTLAFSQMFYFLAYTTPSLTGGDNGLLDIPRPAFAASPWAFYAFVAALFLVVFFLVQRVTESVFGRTLLAIRDNEERALAVGYNVRAFKLLAFVISGAVTGLAGALHAMLTGIAPLANIDYHVSEMILVMTVIGGTGNVFASVLGAAFYVLLSDWLSSLWPRWLMLLGFLLIAVSLFMQRGLFGLGQKLWQRVRAPRQAPAVQEERA